MIRTVHRKRLMVLLMIVAIVFSVAPSSLAAGSKARGVVYGLDEPFFCWVYATDTIPENVTIKEASEEIFMYSPSSSNVREDIFDYSISFVSGDEALKDAIFIRETKDGKRLMIGIDNEVIRQPGEATFHFTFEGKKLRCAEDRVLRVVPYDGNEPFTVFQDQTEILLHSGDLFEKKQIEKAVIRSNIMNIANRMPHENSGTAFYDLGIKTAGELFSFKEDDSFYWGFDIEFGETIDDITITARRAGSYLAEVKYQFVNIEGSVPVTVNIVSYNIEGDDMIRPGQTAKYSIVDQDPYIWYLLDQGIYTERTFTWTLEGEGAELTINGNTAIVSAGSNIGSVILTAKPDNGDPVIQKRIGISNGVLAAYETTATRHNGFIYGRITDETAGFYSIKTDDGYVALKIGQETQKIELMVSYVCYSAPSFLEDPDDADAFYESDNIPLSFENGSLLDHGTMEIEGHPARWYIAPDKMYDRDVITGSVLYVRNDVQLLIRIVSLPTQDGQLASMVTYSDLKQIMDTISYDPSMLDIVQADGAITIVSKEATHILTAGKKLNFSAVFSKPEITNNTEYNAVNWSVTDAETGKTATDITITETGVLSADKKIDSVRELKVICASDMFHTQAEYEVTVMPVIKQISLDPAEVFLYEGDNTEVVVRAILNPDVAPLCLTWTPKKDGIAKVTVKDDGTAVFRAVSAGKDQVTVREPGGKSINLKVNVVAPVTGLTLGAKGKASPGKAVNFSAVTDPKNAGNKSLEWSVDVDEKIATISAKGVLKISKDAVPGTVITVTCKALGAPEPVVSAMTVTVE